MAKVDVIIPAFNAARFLPTALESVLAQSFSDWRITVVDDGSVDETAEVVKPYLQRLGSRMQYLRKENGGPSAARNLALRSTDAPFVALLDADDVWVPQRLALSIALLESRDEVGLTYGFIHRIDEQGAVVDSFTQPAKHAEGWVAPFLYMRSLDLPCPTITFRRTCIEAVGVFDEDLRSAEDRDLWVRLASRFQVALIPQILAHYRFSPQSLTTDPERMLQAQLRFIAKHADTPGLGSQQRRVALSNIYRQRAEALAIRGQASLALQSALKAWRYHLGSVRNARTAASLLAQAAGYRPRHTVPH